MRSLFGLINALVLAAGILPGTVNATEQPRDNASAAPVSQTDVQGLRDDIQRMKGLVQQMEQNLAFVDTTQSPLKHQFQLEIDMWKTMIGEMERKLNSGKRP
jgi:uncharacterized protein with NAD-binding domain and iron-sulfur cluster